jgi:hypothetical protein
MEDRRLLEQRARTRASSRTEARESPERVMAGAPSAADWDPVARGARRSRGPRPALVLAALAALAMLVPAAAQAALGAFPSGLRIAPGTMPRGAASQLVLVAPQRSFAAGQIAATGGGAVRWSADSAPELVADADLFQVAETRVKGRPTADPLPRLVSPLHGPGVIFVRVSTERLRAGTYRGQLLVGSETMPVELTVSSFSLPPRTRGFRAFFTLQPGTYYRAIDGVGSYLTAQRAERPLYELLSDYRISPGDWGYGAPGPTGYTAYNASTMQANAGFGFNTMKLPLSNQRKVGAYAGGVSPREPETWSTWLRRIRPFWLENGYAERAVAWTWDEPGRAQMPLLARHAEALHAAFPEAKLLSTITPGPGSRHLRDGGTDDLDIWAVLSRRFYGTFRDQQAGYRYIRELRARRKELWSFTYHGVPGSPGYDATEALANPRLFFVWNALEGTQGTLYSDGMTRYKVANPWKELFDHGQTALIYPGSVVDPRPVTSLRLESIRDGIADANILTAYAQRFGRPALVRLVADAGLFRARGSRLLLGCSGIRCEVRTTTKYAFPLWQRDARRAAIGLEQVRARALAALERGGAAR